MSGSKSENKLVKTVMDAAVLSVLVTGISWLASKITKEEKGERKFLGDPSGSLTNYFKLSAALAGSIALKRYLIEEKIIPDNV